MPIALYNVDLPSDVGFNLNTITHYCDFQMLNNNALFAAAETQLKT